VTANSIITRCQFAKVLVYCVNIAVAFSLLSSSHAFESVSEVTAKLLESPQLNSPVVSYRIVSIKVTAN